MKIFVPLDEFTLKVNFFEIIIIGVFGKHIKTIQSVRYFIVLSIPNKANGNSIILSWIPRH